MLEKDRRQSVGRMLSAALRAVDLPTENWFLP